MRLIDADALKKTVRNMSIDYYGDLCIGDALHEIDSAPTVDFIKRGRWERVVNAYGELEGFMCECGCQSGSAPNFCPSCGARMDGDEE